MKPDLVQFYCERDPYYAKSREYYMMNVNHYETPYYLWMIQEYRTVLLNKQGSWSDRAEQHWGFINESDRTIFMLRWS
jgi:hypothetical protein